MNRLSISKNALNTFEIKKSSSGSSEELDFLVIGNNYKRVMRFELTTTTLEGWGSSH